MQIITIAFNHSETIALFNLKNQETSYQERVDKNTQLCLTTQ